MCKKRLRGGGRSELCKARESEINVSLWGEFDWPGLVGLSILFRCEVLVPASLVLKIH